MTISIVCLLVYGYSENIYNIKNICVYSLLSDTEEYNGETFVDVRDKLGWISFSSKVDIPETCCHAFRDYPATGVD
jgi:hypothetical protein